MTVAKQILNESLSNSHDRDMDSVGEGRMKSSFFFIMDIIFVFSNVPR